MAIWKLKPVDPGDHNWRGSKHVGLVYVRARNEEAARLFAMNTFGKSVELLRVEEIPLQPWNLSRFVTCEHVADSSFEEEGPDAILGPEEALARMHPSLTDNG